MKLLAAMSVIAISAPAMAYVGPTQNSAAAATATAQHNALCGSPVEPYYWEIGDQSGTLVSGSRGSSQASGPILSSTEVSFASASKWLYGTYVTQLRGSAANLTDNDISALNFTSGYTNMVDGDGACPPGLLNPDTVNQCLTLSNPDGVPYTAMNRSAYGKFDYNSAHMEIHASRYTSLGRITAQTIGPKTPSLGSEVSPLLGSGVTLGYAEPLMAGGANASGATYALILRHILTGSLAMHGALGTHAVCTHHVWNSTACDAVFSPIPEAWHYSIGHWVEDDPATNGDGAFSSPGDYGFYPWIDAGKKYYGIISRSDPPDNDGTQHGYVSAQCGRLIRHAWMTGVEQTGSIPTAPK